MLRRSGRAAYEGRWTLLVLILSSLMPLAFRLLHMAENRYALHGFDLPGIVGDLGTGIAATLLLVLARRAGLVVFALAVLLWVSLNTGYYEFLRQFGSPYFLIHVGQMFDGTFLEGSGTRVSHPLLVAAAGLLTAAGAWTLSRRLTQIRTARLLAIALAAILLANLVPIKTNMTLWRQRNFVALNLQDVVQRGLEAPRVAHAQASDLRLADEALRPDLSGTPILKAQGKRNVIIVFIESVSGGHLPSLAAANGTQSDVSMPQLDAIARGGLIYSTFITTQNQSNRGLYAAICGDLPRLVAGIPKMSDVANGIGKPCLPEVLRRAGYATLFMKSANSDYMLMGDFMRKVGFETAFGEEGFDEHYPRGDWGLDDASLYAGSLERIEALAKGPKPYFVAMFTSSTHHPFQVPAGAKVEGSTPRERAWSFADQSVAGFVRQLEARGYLKDTLLLITSDEAAFVRDPSGRKDDTLSVLSENWGYMVALVPEGARGRIDEPFQETDIPLSVLDYLGLPSAPGHFIGRSFFRHYDHGRSHQFAAVYHRRIYEYVDDEALTVCDEDLSGCRRYDARGRRLFGPELKVIDENAKPSETLRAVRIRSIASPLAAPGTG